MNLALYSYYVLFSLPTINFPTLLFLFISFQRMCFGHWFTSGFVSGRFSREIKPIGDDLYLYLSPSLSLSLSFYLSIYIVNPPPRKIYFKQLDPAVVEPGKPSAYMAVQQTGNSAGVGTAGLRQIFFLQEIFVFALKAFQLIGWGTSTWSRAITLKVSWP